MKCAEDGDFVIERRVGCLNSFLQFFKKNLDKIKEKIKANNPKTELQEIHVMRHRIIYLSTHKLISCICHVNKKWL